MARYTTMTDEAISIRGDMLEDAVATHGYETVAAWADDPVKVRMLNAMAQLAADDRADAREES